MAFHLAHPLVRAFCRALEELAAEGGVAARHARYAHNHAALVSGMTRLGFEMSLARQYRSPIITAFHYPQWPGFAFRRFYDVLKGRGFVIYPGKVSRADTFRVGTIGRSIRRIWNAWWRGRRASGFAS
jgi:2-aminoethylphosphonate-pyruvate transaminase